MEVRRQATIMAEEQLGQRRAAAEEARRRQAQRQTEGAVAGMHRNDFTYVTSTGPDGQPVHYRQYYDGRIERIEREYLYDYVTGTTAAGGAGGGGAIGQAGPGAGGQWNAVADPIHRHEFTTIGINNDQAHQHTFTPPMHQGGYDMPLPNISTDRLITAEERERYNAYEERIAELEERCNQLEATVKAFLGQEE
jgi:hypothetical protein